MNTEIEANDFARLTNWFNTPVQWIAEHVFSIADLHFNSRFTLYHVAPLQGK